MADRFRLLVASLNFATLAYSPYMHNLTTAERIRR
jgi:hypothetical protein